MTIFTPMGALPNQMPVLDRGQVPQLPNVKFNAGPPIGNVGMTVANLLAQTDASDPDADVLGMAVTEVAEDATFYYRLSSNDPWQIATDLSDDTALLLGPQAWVYVVPPAHEGPGDSVGGAFYYRAWDQTTGQSGDTGVNANVGPRLTATTGLPDHAGYDIFVSDGMAFIPLQTGGARLIDLSNPTAPVEGAVIHADNDVYDVLVTAINGTRIAYVASLPGVAMYDLTDPSSPVLLGKVVQQGYAFDLSLSGSTLTIGLRTQDASGNAVLAYNVSGAEPTVLPSPLPNISKELDTLDVLNDLIVVHDYQEHNVLTVYQIGANGHTPIWTEPSNFSFENVALYDGRLFFTSYQGLGSLDPTEGPNAAITWHHYVDSDRLQIVDGKAYTTDSDDEVIMFDLKTNIRRDIDVSGEAEGLAVLGDFVYVINHEEGLQVIDTVGSTAFSSRTAEVDLQIDMQDAPVLDTAGNPTLPVTTTAPEGAVGTQVSALIQGRVSDTETNVAEIGIAVTGVRGGTLHYSLDNGTTWQTLTGLVDEKYALLLAPDARVYFVPSADGVLSDALSFKAWDRSLGTSGEKGVYTLPGSGPILSSPPVDKDGAGTVALTFANGKLYSLDTSVVSEAATLTIHGFPQENLRAPVLEAQIDLAGVLTDITTDWSYLYIASSTGLAIYDVESSDQPTLIGTLDNVWANKVQVFDDFAYVLGGNSTLSIVSLVDRAQPTVLGSIPNVDARALAVTEGLVFAATQAGVTVVDVSNPAAPNMLTQIPLTPGGTVYDVLYANDYLYVATSAGVRIVSLEGPNGPVEGRLIALPNGAQTIMTDYDRLYVGSDDEVLVYDLWENEPDDPVFVRSLKTSEDVEDIYVIENQVYVAAGEAGLQVLTSKGNTAFSQAEETISVGQPDDNSPNPGGGSPNPGGTPTPTTPPVSTPIDGVPVQVGTGTDGQQQITVPVVTPNRDEDTSTPNGRLADIAVVKNAAGVSLLNLGLPVGTGLTTNGPATTVTGTNAQSVLDGRITSASGSAEQKASAQAFLASLPSDTQVVVQTVTVTAQGTAGGPLVVSAANLADGHKTVVVIDTRSLPAGTLIDLENIDFAVVVGDARVTGGAGANLAYGDNDAQFIVLGEGDDVLHGGGGDDTVGSLRGNDQVFGDAGNDVVYGGSGNDTLTGGTGNDAMNGGFGFDTGVQAGARGDYTVRTENGSVILTHRTSGEIDRFTDVERITFDSGKAIVIAHEAADVATLRPQYANDDLIELNLTRAIIGSEGRDVITPELGVGRNIDLGAGQDVVKLAGGRDDVHLDVEAGQIVDLTRLEDGAMLSLKNVELLEFSNGDVTVLAQNNDQAILGRAYELLLGRNVDVDGFQFWAEALNAGVSLQSVLQSIVTSQEAADMYKLANGNFIEQLYVQGLDRTSDAAGKTYWADALASGVSRAVVLEGFAGSAEAVDVIGSTVDVNIVS